MRIVYLLVFFIPFTVCFSGCSLISGSGVLSSSDTSSSKLSTSDDSDSSDLTTIYDDSDEFTYSSSGADDSDTESDESETEDDDSDSENDDTPGEEELATAAISPSVWIILNWEE